MNRIIKTVGLFLLVSTFTFATAQEKESDDTKKGADKTGMVDDNRGKGKIVTAKTAPEAKKKLASHEADTQYGTDKGMKSKGEKGGWFSRMFGGKNDAKSVKEETKENDTPKKN